MAFSLIHKKKESQVPFAISLKALAALLILEWKLRFDQGPHGSFQAKRIS